MTTQEVANRLVELCRSGQYGQAQDELYAQDVESIESPSAPVPYVKGYDAVKQKDREFNNMVEEVYGGSVSEPMVAGNFFTLTMSMDVKFKGQERMNMEEVCVYEVRDGKVVKEQFFF
jgi:hypothetical protein